MRVRRPPTPAARRFWKLYTERPKPSEMLLSSLSSLVSPPLSTLLLRHACAWHERRAPERTSLRSFRSPDGDSIPALREPQDVEQTPAGLARSLSDRERVQALSHPHSSIERRVRQTTPTASHRMSHPLSSACCVVLHVCRPLFSCRRISAPCPGRFVLLDSYCALRALI